MSSLPAGCTPGRLVLILDIGFFVRSVYLVGTVVDFLNNISHISVYVVMVMII